MTVLGKQGGRIRTEAGEHNWLQRGRERGPAVKTEHKSNLGYGLELLIKS